MELGRLGTVGRSLTSVALRISSKLIFIEVLKKFGELCDTFPVSRYRGISYQRWGDTDY